MPRRASRQNIGSLSRGETHEEEKEEEKRRRRRAKVEGKGDVERVWNTAESFPPPCTRGVGEKCAGNLGWRAPSPPARETGYRSVFDQVCLAICI